MSYARSYSVSHKSASRALRVIQLLKCKSQVITTTHSASILIGLAFMAFSSLLNSLRHNTLELPGIQHGLRTCILHADSVYRLEISSPPFNHVVPVCATGRMSSAAQIRRRHRHNADELAAKNREETVTLYSAKCNSIWSFGMICDQNMVFSITWDDQLPKIKLTSRLVTQTPKRKPTSPSSLPGKRSWSAIRIPGRANCTSTLLITLLRLPIWICNPA